jgi:hypothetical protein
MTDDELSLDGYIRSQWSAGERDIGQVTERLIKLILASPDPVALLDPVMRSEVHNRYRSLSRALQRGGLGIYGLPAGRPSGSTPAGSEALDRRTRLMQEYRWVPSRGNVRYADCTITDLQECAAWLGEIRAGLDHSISWLRSAIRAMERNHAKRLGELPAGELPAGTP